ncbi:DUF6387 family protein [Neptuniibacter sp. QD37_11]|uniref:DUF6387 family protein n=1 Tax=Neptuniibacter sp. QD37_11 TaxID=3398209 RepID=UPI0039F527F8
MKKTGVNELPEWFNLANYEAVTNFTKSDWYRELYHRSSARDDLEVLGEFQTSLEAVKEIRQSGLLDQRWDPLREKNVSVIEDPLDLDGEKHGYDSGITTPAVTPLLTFQILSAGNVVSQKLDELAKSKESTDHLLLQAPYDLFRKHNDIDGHDHLAFLSIDMTLPNNKIIEQFKQLLPKYRKALGITATSRKDTDVKMYDLKKYKILAIIDLLIWEEENNKTINRQLLVNSVYGPYGIVQDRGLSQTVIPLAREAVDESFLKILESSITQ